MKRTLATILALVTVLSCLGAVFASAEGIVRGDVNGDGRIDAIDYMILKRFILRTMTLLDEGLAAADIDGDGAITATDYRLLKQYVLRTYPLDTATKGKGYPPRTGETDFALGLTSSIEDGVMTVILTVGSFGDGVQMQDLIATLTYDPEKLTLTNQINMDGDLNCATELPYGENSRWENLTVADDGVINIAFAVPQTPTQYLDAAHNIVLTFTFELAEGVTEATVTVPSESVRGVGDDVAYYGEGASATAKEEPSVEPEPPVDDPVERDFRYRIVDGRATVTGYSGEGGNVVIPSALGGAPVTAIGANAFANNETITTIVIPAGVTVIEANAFASCTNLTDIFCSASSKPDGWENAWSGSETAVHWEYAHAFGDIGGDGRIDATDYLLLKRYCLGTFALNGEQKAVSDVNRDGKINEVDYLLIKRHVLGTFKIA